MERKNKVKTKKKHKFAQYEEIDDKLLFCQYVLA